MHFFFFFFSSFLFYHVSFLLLCVALFLPGGSHTVLASFAPGSRDALREAVALWDANETLARTLYGRDISSWNISNVTSLRGVFKDTSFNCDISKWKTSSVTDMTETFYNAISFNSDLQQWDVTSVKSFQRAFFNAHAFSRDLSSWNTSQGKNFEDMLTGAGILNMCPTGRFGNSSQPSHLCRKCQPGRYSVTHGQTSRLTCIACPEGRASQEHGRSEECGQCEPGTFQQLRGQETCIKCPRGRYQESSGSLNCLQCSPGHFSGAEGAARCQSCPSGKFQYASGRTSCYKLDAIEHFSSGIMTMKWIIGDPLENVTALVYKEDLESIPIRSDFTILQMNNSYLTGYIETIYGIPFYVELIARDVSGASISMSSKKPIMIPCPRFACCGTEHENSTVCAFNQSRGVTIAGIAAQRGAFRGDNFEDFQPCPYPRACRGGIETTCKEGYTGKFCGHCENQYAKQGSDCFRCSAITTLVFVLAIIIGTGACVYFIRAVLSGDEKTHELEMLKIAFSGSQAMVVLFRFPLHWPREVRYTFTEFGKLFASAGEAVSLMCILDESSSKYIRHSTIILSFPILFLLIAAAFWTIHYYWRQKAVKPKQVLTKFTASAIVILYFVLPSLTQRAFELFTCQKVGGDWGCFQHESLRNKSMVKDEDFTPYEFLPCRRNNGTWYMAGDYDFECYGREQILAILLAGLPCVLLYTFGIPFWTFYVVRKLKLSGKLFSKKDESFSGHVFKFLYAGFKKDAYYWEVVVTARKLLLNIFFVILAATSPFTQGLSVYIILQFFTLAQIFKMPYNHPTLNRIETCSLCLSSIELYMGLYLFDVKVNQGVKTIITIFMLVSTATAIGLFAFMLGLEIRKHRRLKDAKQRAQRAISFLAKAKDSAADVFTRLGSEFDTTFERIARRKAEAGEDLNTIDFIEEVCHSFNENLRDASNPHEIALSQQDAHRDERRLRRLYSASFVESLRRIHDTQPGRTDLTLIGGGRQNERARRFSVDKRSLEHVF